VGSPVIGRPTGLLEAHRVQGADGDCWVRNWKATISRDTMPLYSFGAALPEMVVTGPTELDVQIQLVATGQDGKRLLQELFMRAQRAMQNRSLAYQVTRIEIGASPPDLLELFIQAQAFGSFADSPRTWDDAETSLLGGHPQLRERLALTTVG